MESNTKNQPESLKSYGYDLDFGNVFNEIFENYKKVALILGCIILLLMVVFSALTAVFAGIFFGVGGYTEFLTGVASENKSATVLIVSFITAILGSAIIAPLSAGMLKIVHLAQKNEEFNFGNAFDYYKSVYIKDLFFAIILISTVENILKTGLELANQFNLFEDGDLLFTVLTIIVGLLISIFTMFTIPSIIFGNLKALDAIKSSLIIVSKNLFTIIGLMIVCGILSALGIIGLCIGIFFTLPIWYSMIYSIYCAALPIEELDEIDEIGKSDFFN